MTELIKERKSLTVSEVVSGAARLSPIEDFATRTLSAIPGLWRKFLYMAELRSADGKYEHWGHRRIHGELSSQQALASIHSQVYLDVLRMPLRELMSAGEDQNYSTAASFPVELQVRMVPSELQGGSPRHFNSIALAVRYLSAARQASTRLDA